MVEELPAGQAVIDLLDNLHLAEADRTILFLNFITCLDLQLRALSAVVHSSPQVEKNSLVESLERCGEYHLRGLKLINQLVILSDLIDHKGNVAAYLLVGAMIDASTLQDG